MNKNTFFKIGATLTGAFWGFVAYIDTAFIIGWSAEQIRSMNLMMLIMLAIGGGFGFMFYLANCNKRSKKAKAA